MSPGARAITVGLASIAVLFLVYARYASDASVVGPGSLEPLQRMAYAFYALLAAAMACAAWGARRLHADASGDGALARIAAATRPRRPRAVFVATLVAYGTAFALMSGTLVHQPGVSFSYHYGAEVPSVEVAPCCDAPGYMPKVLVYLTDSVGLQVVPVNLVLQAAVSWLVALNTSIAAAAIMASRARRSVSGVGAIAGLFVACPTCAGSAASAILGTAGGISLGVALAQAQTGLIAISIPVLLATPLLLARRLPARAC